MYVKLLPKANNTFYSRKTYNNLTTKSKFVQNLKNM